MSSCFGLTTEEWVDDNPYLALKWGGRPETTQSIAASLTATLRTLSGYGSPYDQPWHYAPEVMAPRLPVPGTEPETTAFVEFWVHRDDSGEPWPEIGYSFLIHTPEPVVANLDVQAGHQKGSPKRPVNQVMLDWRVAAQASDQAEGLYTHIREHAGQMLTDLVQIWSPDVATLTSSAIITDLTTLVPFSWPRLGAITWLPGALYTIPDHVPGASVQRRGPDTILTVGTPDNPSLRVEDVMAVYTYLKDHDHLHPPT